MEIKGTKDGILVNLENQDWLEAKGDLVGQIDARLDFFNGAQLILDVGNNVLRAKELGELRDFLSEKGVLLSGIISQSIVTKETAQMLGMTTKLTKTLEKPAKKIKPLDTVIAGDAAVMIHRTMRSGFKVAYQGHVVVIGDVNPGAEIIASGSIVVWGHLRGTVHAGAEGDEAAVICALDLSPMQLRIGSHVAVSPPQSGKPQPEIASVKENQIIAEPWQY
ncbi:MAG: septum site-determining protein MinC [Anaerolineaceae bacterium]|jgi:septum site-determining protein MinC|nr:septum site-determining protein MinC [Anaerolineaceae bacterium]